MWLRYVITMDFLALTFSMSLCPLHPPPPLSPPPRQHQTAIGLPSLSNMEHEDQEYVFSVSGLVLKGIEEEATKCLRIFSLKLAF